jgi:hypothetical protein
MYQYELDDGTEIHDTSLPFTMACPYMPGQPVNLLSVPVEIHPLRDRSASLSSIASIDKMTMNPSDKFMTPRPPPSRPVLGRLKTAPYSMSIIKKRSARSVSPKPPTPKSPWSPKSFFGLRSPTPLSVPEGDTRGRSDSNATLAASDVKYNYPMMGGRIDDERNMRSLQQPRETSPQSFRRTRSRDPSPLGKLVAVESDNYSANVLVIPDEIEEEDAEDDANFADHLRRLSFLERNILTPLAPPPGSSRFPSFSSEASTPNTKDLSKPLPLLPDEMELAPNAAAMPGSHFSVSTISTIMTSPSDSHFCYSDSASLADDEDLSLDIGSDGSPYSPIVHDADTDADMEAPLNAYRLPDEEYGSQQTIDSGKAANRSTFGGVVESPTDHRDETSLSALQELINEIRYLGDYVNSK